MKKFQKKSLLARGAPFFAAILCFARVGLCGDPITLYVDDDATPGGDGFTWSTALDSLHCALEFASTPGNEVSEIRVAQGTYVPIVCSGPSQFRDVTFRFVPGTSLLGGFAGVGAPNPDARDIALYETILSGDLNGDDGPNFANNSENCYHVVTMTNTGALNNGAIFEGFTVSGGNADGIASLLRNKGGAIFNSQLAAPIRNCRFKSNSANFGGGAVRYFSSGVIEDCVFEENRCYGDGGALLADLGNVTANILRCRFENNVVNTSGNGTGGGLSFQCNHGNIDSCLFIGNNLREGGSAGGGGAYFADTDGLITNCLFVGNNARRYGGGAYYAAVNGSKMINCLFVGNTTGIGWSDGRDGGGLCFGSLDRPEVINCTFVGNYASRSQGGIGSSSENHVATVTNCILWGNADSGFSTQNAQIGGPAPILINYSCVNGWTGLLGGVGNFGSNPLFVDADGADDDPATLEDNDYRLASGSPCIDTGNNSAVPVEVVLDLDGNDRFVDDPAAPDGGSGTAPIVDRGAYEVQVEPVCPADLVGDDGIVNVSDLFALLSNWNTNGPGAGLAKPFDIVNVNDLFALLAAWGACD